MKRLRFYLFLFVLATALSVAGRAPAGELDEIYRLTDEKKLDQAMKKLEAFLQEHPRDAEARFLQGLIFTGKSQSDDAIRVFKELGKDFPDLPEPFNNLAVLYAERGDYENARQALVNAVRILPDYATAHENLGDVYAKLASQSYAQALRINNANGMVSAKLDVLKKVFGMPTAPAGESASPVIAAKPPVKQAAVAAAAKEPVVQNVADTAVRAEVDPAAQGAVADEVSAEPAAAAPAGGSMQAEVEATAHAWAKAWASRQVEDYLSFYSDTAFTPDKFPDREAWKQQRRLAIGAAGNIRVTLSGLKVAAAEGNRVQVTFTQSYWSKRYQDKVNKTLVMQKEGSAWKIVREY
ncbi:MAG: tetratricopeptide repeat protein [Magnetococcales bacterium]|nr:tetratricopeptide repeat protein [Magnetococcales bacterium]